MKSIMKIAAGVAVGLLSLSGSVSAQDSSSSTGAMAMGSSTGATMMGSSTGATTTSTGAAMAASSSSGASSGPYSSSICDQYAHTLGLNSAAGEYQLMGMLVTRAFMGNVTSNGQVVEGLANNALTKPFFNGANPTWRSAAQAGQYGTGANLPNFIESGTPQSGLVDSLSRFFGAALKCTAPGFTTTYAYAGNTNQTSVHSSMPITQDVFNAFNAQVANAATSYGVTSTDVNTVGGLLGSFQRGAAGSTSSICNDVATCSCAQDFSGSVGQACTVKTGAASTVGVSAFSVLMAAAAAMFAMRQ